jgi:hypothetical protein
MTDRFKRLAPLSGVLMVAAIVVMLALPSTPDSNASGAKVIAFYRHHHTALYVAGALAAYAGALGILYFSSVASYLRSRGADLLATLTVVGGAVFGAGLMLGAGALFAANDGPQHFGVDEARTLNVLQNNLFIPVFLGGLAIATLSMGVAMLRNKSLPKALGIITVVVGVVCLSGIGSWFGFLASGPLTLVIAGYVYQRLGSPAQISLPPEIPVARTSTEQVATSETASS